MLIGDRKKYPAEVLDGRLPFVDMKPLSFWTENTEDVESYPFSKPFEDIADDVVVWAHTSGSTSLPKPIPLKNSAFAVMDSTQLVPQVPGREEPVGLVRGRRLFGMLPPFHFAGLFFLAGSIFWDSVSIVLPAPDEIPNSDTVQRILDQGLADMGVIAPSVLEEASLNPEFARKLSLWDYVVYGAAPLPRAAGEILVHQYHVRLFNVLGTTETGYLAGLRPEDPEDWEYLEYHPVAGVEMRPREEGLFEAVVARNPETIQFQSTFCTFPDAQEYAIGDLYEPHPTKPTLYRLVGRNDDVIVLSNGEKVIPTYMEQLITAHPDVVGALYGGQGKFQPIVIIQPTPEAQKLSNEQKIDQIWDTIVEANKHAPGHAKIDQEHILFLKEGENFRRATKGLIVRRSSLQAFASAIDEAYREVEKGARASARLDLSSADGLRQSLLDYFRSSSLALLSLKPDESLFSREVDSLQAIRLVRGIRGGVEKSTKRPVVIPNSFLYRNYTIDMLVQAILSLIGQSSSTKNGISAEARMELLLEKYSLPSASALPQSPVPSPTEGRTVILTGSTGSLGGYMLYSLLKDKSVGKVYCFNRSANAIERQKSFSKSRELLIDFDSPRVEFLETNLSAERFGLAQSKYDRLLAEVTHVMHNAWAVDFNQDIDFFEPHVAGCRNLIDLALASRHHSEILFVSSISAATRHQGSIPEDALTNLFDSEPMGYGQSKLVAELLFRQANQVANLKISICRVGQIAGPVLRSAGVWNPKEWFPSLVKSSKFLDKIPSSLGRNEIDWIPVDLLGQIMVELLFVRDGSVSESSSSTLYFHVVNPNVTQWKTLLPAMQAAAPTAEVVDLGSWVSALATSAEQANVDAIQNPGTKLVEFYQGLQEANSTLDFETKASRVASKTLSDLPAVSPAWLASWIDQWKAVEA
jgi:thioester reductase-like protein